MSIIQKHLIKETAINILFIMGGLLAMFAFFDLLQELDNIGKGSYGLGKIVLFVLLSAPGHIYEIVPVAVLIGSMYSLAQFARNSELIILRVSGLSILSIGGLLLRIGLVFTLLTFIVGELVTPISEKTAQRIRIKAIDSVVAQDFRSGLWVKDGNSFVNIEQVHPDAELAGVHIYSFGQDFELNAINTANSAKFNGDSWELKDVTVTQLFKDKVETKKIAEENWKSLIRPELLNVLLVLPERMSAWNLYSYITHLAKNNQKTSRYEIALWAKMIYPIACIVMVMLALPFGFLQQRSGGIAYKILIGIMLGIFYQILNRVFLHLGLLNDWSAFTSAIIPTFIFFVASLLMLSWVERH